MKAKLSWILIGFMVIALLGGCTEQEEKEPPVLEEQMEAAQPVAAEPEEKPEEVEAQEEVLTDEAFVFDEAWMWNKYMYETITSLGNAKHFDQNDLTEIDELVEYVWLRYCDGFDSVEAMGFEQSPEITAYYLFPRELAYKEAEKYFTFDLSQASLEDSYVYLEEFDAFQMHYVGPREEGEISGDNPWAIYYEGVEALGNGRYEARMVSYEDKEAGIVRREMIYRIRLGEAGTFLFESGERRMPVYPLSDFNKEIMPLDEWKDQIDEYALLIGESRSELFFLEQDEQVKIHRVAKADYHMVDSLTLLFEPEEHLVQIHETEDGGSFLVCTSHYVRVFNESWEEIERLALPAFFTGKVLSETTWDDFRLATIFTGYDVTDDLSQIVYGDEEGLKWFALGTTVPEIKLLEKSEEYPEDDLAPLSVYLDPRWVEGGQKIFVVRSGYEGNRGIALYDFREQKINRYDHGWNVWYSQIEPNKGVIMPNEFDYNWETGEGRTLHYYLNFATGERSEFVLDRMGGDDMPDGGETYYGENILALLIKDYQADPLVTYLQRIDPETWELIDETAIQAAHVRILGADQAGNVFVYYFYNQDSRGFGVLPSVEHQTEESYTLSDLCGQAISLDAWQEEKAGNVLYSRPQLIGETDREWFFNGLGKIYGIAKEDLNQVDVLSFAYEKGEYNKFVKPIRGDRYVAGTNHNLHVFNAEWEEEQVISLPVFFQNLLASDGERETPAGVSATTWYDVSEDLTQIVFSNETGLKLFELGEEEPEVRLLAELEDTEQDWTSVYMLPQFVDQDRQIFVKRSGNEESLLGVGLYDLQTRKLNKFEMGLHTSSISVLPEKGVLIPGEQEWLDQNHKKGIWHTYLDFSSGEKKEFVLDQMSSYFWDDMDIAYHGESYLLTLAKENNPGTIGGSTTHIQVIDAESLKQVRDVEVKAAMVQLMGIDRAGNIFFHYWLNPQFQGYGFIPVTDGL